MLAVIVLLRMVLKVLFIDIDTGFYLGGMPLAYLCDALTFITVVGVVVLLWRKAPGVQPPSLQRGNRLLELSAALLGVVLLVSSALQIPAALSIRGRQIVNHLPAGLLLLEHGLGILGGAAMLFVAFCLFSGAARGGMHGTLALLPVLWQAINMVEHYISFRQVNTVSDQLLETLFLVSATLFFLAQSRCIAGFDGRERSCIWFGLFTALFGFATAAGQAAALAVLGASVAGPTPLRLAVIGATSLYALVLSLTLALRGARQER